jgi:serine/threonine-protein phosphatase 2A activator
VWGLDDSHFLGYIFGSAQLRDQNEVPVSAILHPPLPPTNLYFLSIMRIHEVKRGPFHEHSSQLYSIATGVTAWKKVNSGLFKMYEAEVLGKRVVVQHLPLGGILEWNVIGAPRNVTGVSRNRIYTVTPVPRVPGTTVNAASNGALVTSVPWGSSSASISEERGAGSSTPHLRNSDPKV